MSAVARLRDRQEWRFFGALFKADPGLAVAWWVVLVCRGVLPAVFAVATGALVGAVQGGRDLAGPLAAVGVVFVLLQVLVPVHQAIGTNLGDRTAAWLYDRLTEACVRPPGMGHLEDPALSGDLTAARDFDLGMTGPPLSISMDFIAGGLVELARRPGRRPSSCSASPGGRRSLLAGAWLATHWLLRESSVWRDRATEEVRSAQRDADYTYRLAVDPPAAKELRLFGLAGWTIERFTAHRRRLHELQYRATRLRERPLAWSIALVVGANLVVFWALADAAAAGRLDLDQVVVFAQVAVGTSMIAFGGLNWALDGAAAPVAASLRVAPAMAAAGALAAGDPPGRRHAGGRDPLPRRPLRLPGRRRRCSTASTSTSRPAPRWPSSGRTAPARPPWPSCSAGCTTPRPGRSRSTGSTCASSTWTAWRARVAAVFQDFIRFELPLRDNVAPAGADDDTVLAALAAAGADGLAALDTVLARGYRGGTDLSGGQWQRVALARALCAVRLGAGVVLLDEPTAQLDVRGEAEIFDRILAATRHCTTILISHRFSTVRHADRICVLEGGRVVELGSHDELHGPRRPLPHHVRAPGQPLRRRRGRGGGRL